MEELSLSRTESTARALFWRRIAMGLGPWVLVGTLVSLHVYFFGQYQYRSRSDLWNIAFYELPIWCLWWPTQTLISRLGRRWRFSSASWLRPLLAHLGASLLATFILMCVVAVWALQAFPFTLRDDATFLEALHFFGTSLVAVVFWGLYWLLLISGQTRLLLREIRQRDIHEARLEARVSQARLQALKMQLQPHFLFNSLNSAVSLIHKQEPKKAVGVLHKLSDFLRMTLEDSGEPEIPLRQELAFADRYMRIETTRFPGRLTYRVDVDSDVLEAAVPNLLLQPLLENAVRHTVGANGGRGHMEISCLRSGDRLVVTLRDDGPGVADEVTRPNDILVESAHRSSIDEGSGFGIGLANVRERLCHLYGSEQLIELTNLAPGGLEVRIELPLRLLPHPDEPSSDKAPITGDAVGGVVGEP